VLTINSNGATLKMSPGPWLCVRLCELPSLWSLRYLSLRGVEGLHSLAWAFWLR
jgi:hypothetical protein